MLFLILGTLFLVKCLAYLVTNLLVLLFYSLSSSKMDNLASPPVLAQFHCSAMRGPMPPPQHVGLSESSQVKKDEGIIHEVSVS